MSSTRYGRRRYGLYRYAPLQTSSPLTRHRLTLLVGTRPLQLVPLTTHSAQLRPTERGPRTQPL
jgi:hypothetical protein